MVPETEETELERLGAREGAHNGSRNGQNVPLRTRYRRYVLHEGRDDALEIVRRGVEKTEEHT